MPIDYGGRWQPQVGGGDPNRHVHVRKIESLMKFDKNRGCHCKRLNSELGAQTALHLSVSKGVIQRKRESRSSATSSSNDNSRPGPMAQAVHTGMKYVLFT